MKKFLESGFAGIFKWLELGTKEHVLGGGGGLEAAGGELLLDWQLGQIVFGENTVADGDDGGWKRELNDGLFFVTFYSVPLGGNPV